MSAKEKQIGPFSDIDITLDKTTYIQHVERDQSILSDPDNLEKEYHRLISIFDSKNKADEWNNQRNITIENCKRDKIKGNVPRGILEEHILFWPSAPIYALGWPRVYSLKESRRTPWHTMRLLKRPEQKTIDRIYIFFNGLNEWRTLQTYYRLADLLFLNEERRRRRKNEQFGCSTSACIIRPFPGHLTRHPHSSPFFKLPMAHYLEDAAELYRQFLRHMVETQWLLSSIVPFEDIPLKSGLDLLARGKRHNSEEVTKAISSAWTKLHEADKQARETAGVDLEVPLLNRDVLKKQVDRLRKEVSWKLAENDWHERNNITEVLYSPLSIQCIGYSMGGFVAQATMFTWPQVVASCSMLASGGSLSDVQASFVHEQEWLYVLDRLLPDLENPALAKQIPIEFSPAGTGTNPDGAHATANNKIVNRTPQVIYGLPRGYYSAFRRAFDQIFMQRSVRRREYTAWLEEFHERLLFVLGGCDPVVKVANVIETAPRSGLNVLEVAGLKHELHDRRHKEWYKFWLPRIVTQNIEHFARRREKAHYRILKEYWTKKTGENEIKKDATYYEKSDKELFTGDQREMSLKQLEEELASLIKDGDKIGSVEHTAGKKIVFNDYSSFIFIARNRVPCELFSDAFLEDYGVVQHYSEEEIIESENKRLDRHKSLKDMGDRLLVILPKNYADLEAQSVGGPQAQWADATGGHDWTPEKTRTICNKLPEIWGDRLLPWEANDKDGDTLPDCWYIFTWDWMVDNKCKKSLGKQGVRDKIGDICVKIKQLKQKLKNEKKENSNGDDNNLLKEELDYEVRISLKKMRIIKISPAHVVSSYAGYEILNWGEKLEKLEHLLAVLK